MGDYVMASAVLKPIRFTADIHHYTMVQYPVKDSRKSSFSTERRDEKGE